MSNLKDKIILITGGTGSFGCALTDRLIDSDVKEIRIFSRDEKKQDDMRVRYVSDKLKFYIGDVRDERTLKPAMRNVDYVFHAAALKQVPSTEYFPIEATKTNVLGTENVIEAAIDASVKHIVCLSTDKAVEPMSAMGISKALMEKVAVAQAMQLGEKGPIINVTRYGNVIASRGSVVTRFYEQIEVAQPVTITAPDMTRFMMTMDEALDLVLYAFTEGKQGEKFIPKTSAVSIKTLAEAMIELFADNPENYPIEVVGVRPGEKYFESLMTTEEKYFSRESDKFYAIPANFPSEEYKEQIITEAFTSNNTKLMTKDEMIEKLKESKYIKERLG